MTVSAASRQPSRQGSAGAAPLLVLAGFRPNGEDRHRRPPQPSRHLADGGGCPLRLHPFSQAPEDEDQVGSLEGLHQVGLSLIGSGAYPPSRAVPSTWTPPAAAVPNLQEIRPRGADLFKPPHHSGSGLAAADHQDSRLSELLAVVRVRGLIGADPASCSSIHIIPPGRPRGGEFPSQPPPRRISDGYGVCGMLNKNFRKGYLYQESGHRPIHGAG